MASCEFTRIPGTVMDALPTGSAAGAEQAKLALKETVEAFNRQWEHQHPMSPRKDGSTLSPVAGAEEARTMCRPQFKAATGDAPINFNAAQLPAEILDVSEFDSSKVLLAIEPLV